MTAPSLRALGAVVASTTNTPSFAAPAGAVSSDVIVVAFFADDGRRTMSSVPTGFTIASGIPQINDATAGSPSHALYVYWGRFSDVGAGPYGFTLSGTAGFIEGRTAAIQACVTSGNPIEAANGNTSGNTSVTTAPAVSATSTGTDRYAFYVATNWNGGAWTPATGYTEQWDANDEVCTFDDLAMPTAATTSPQAVCAGNSRSNAWVGIFLPVASATATSSATPYVVSRPAQTSSAPALLSRGSLANPPVLTTPSPYVVTTPTPTRPAAPLLLSAPAAPAAAPSAATPQPVVITAQRAGGFSPPIVIGSPAAPPPGVQPIVISSPAAQRISPSVLLRGDLVDPPVLTIPSPIVVTATMPVRIAQAILTANPQAPVVQPAVATPGPIVVTAQPAQAAPEALLIRGSAAPPAATPGPIVVTAAQPARASLPILARGSLADLYAGTVPLVVTAPKPGSRSAALLLSSPQVSSSPPPVVQPRPPTVTVDLTRPSAAVDVARATATADLTRPDVQVDL